VGTAGTATRADSREAEEDMTTQQKTTQKERAPNLSLYVMAKQCHTCNCPQQRYGACLP